MWVTQRVWVVHRHLWISICLSVWLSSKLASFTHTHTHILTHSFTHCHCLLPLCFGPSVISPGRSEGVSRATSQRPCSKNGRHGYFESQHWPLEHAQKRALSTTWGGKLGGLGEGETRLFNS